MQTRRTTLALLLASASLAACGKGGGGKAEPVTTDDMSLGDPKAPITVVEYASVACPVCAAFNNEVFPAFKKKYIDSGKVHYISREMNAHNPALSTAGFLIARCAGKDKYFQVVDDIYHAQAKMEGAGEVRPTLLSIAKKAGLSEKQFEACISDPVQIEAQTSRVEKFARENSISSTPTFVINGKVAQEGFADLATLDKLIAEAEAEAKAKPAA